MRNQLVHKRMVKYLVKVSENGSVFARKVIHRWIEPYCIYLHFTQILDIPSNFTQQTLNLLADRLFE